MDFNERMRKSLIKQHKDDMRRMEKLYDKYLKRLANPKPSKYNGIFAMMQKAPFIVSEKSPISIQEIKDSLPEKSFIERKMKDGTRVTFVPIPAFDCPQHEFRKTEPSELDEHNTLIWQCIRCGHRVSSM